MGNPSKVLFVVALVITAAILPVAATGAPTVRFAPVAEAWNAGFRHHHGGTGEFYMIETMGSGVAIFDFDGDGDRDLFWVDSGQLDGDRVVENRSVLMRNDGVDGEGRVRFVDVTARSGIRVTQYGQGATAADVDGDGDLDLYVTAFGPNQLFENRDGRFVDITATAAVGDPSWSSSAAFGDVDGDGRLDLYVTNYLDFTFDNNPSCGIASEDIRSYCHPDVYEGVPDRLYRNLGPGTDGTVRFEDATRSLGVAQEATGRPRLGKGLGVVVADLDDDARPDVYVANDMTPNHQFHNRGGTPFAGFEEVAVLSGTAVSDLGNPEAGMGIGIGDIDGNGLPDLAVTHLDLETNAVYSNAGSGLFFDRRFASGLGESSIKKVGFGAAFLDLDNDRDLDFAVANGHIIHNVELWGTGTTYRQANEVFVNDGRGRFSAVGDAGLEAVRASRGLAVGDLDGDGDLDLAISNSNDAAEVYENRTAHAGHWLQIDLRAPAGNTHGLGTRVVIESGGARQVRQVYDGSSYQSRNDGTLHVGLGEAKTIEVVEVRLPGWKTVRVIGIEVDRRLRLPMER